MSQPTASEASTTASFVICGVIRVAPDASVVLVVISVAVKLETQ
jgi:hypothetical protein